MVTPSLVFAVLLTAFRQQSPLVAVYYYPPTSNNEDGWNTPSDEEFESEVPSCDNDEEDEDDDHYFEQELNTIQALLYKELQTEFKGTNLGVYRVSWMKKHLVSVVSIFTKMDQFYIMEDMKWF